MNTSPVELIDSHAHIQGPEFASDLEEVLERARVAGVGKIIVVGGAGNLQSNRDGLELARRHPGLFATVGIHPHDAREMREEDLAWLKGLTEDPRVVAVGETGLDFYYDNSPRKLQMELFCRFIHMARETGLPLVVHDRDAHGEIAAMLGQEGAGEVRGVIHCFTGEFPDAKAFLDLGFYVSFTGIVTFKNAASLREAAAKIPLDRIMVETGSPYLTPVPHRGKRNEPAFVPRVAETLAQIKGIPLEEVARVTSANAHALFGI